MVSAHGNLSSHRQDGKFGRNARPDGYEPLHPPTPGAGLSTPAGGEPTAPIVMRASTRAPSPSEARILRESQRALAPCGRGEQAGLAPGHSRELHGEGQTIGSETGGQ